VANAQVERTQDVQVTVAKGRPTFKSADGGTSLAIRSLVQFDSAYYSQKDNPAGIDFSSGTNFRRARLGVSGTLYKDWAYEFLYDLGGSGGEGASIASAYIQYDGFGPVHIKAGSYPPPENFDDSTSASDLLFLERAQPTDLARSVAGSDGRNAATVFGYNNNYFAALSWTGGLTGDAAVFDEQQAVVGRFAYRFLKKPDLNFAVGVDATNVYSMADTAAGANSPSAFQLRERPELNVDSQNIRLIGTGAIDARSYTEWGVEATGNWKNFHGQGGYFNYEIDRRASALSDPSFNGWYVQGSWILTGEAKPYRADRGAYAAPAPKHPFGKGGAGAWEIAARYSDLDLNDNEGVRGLATPLGGIRGGEQKIWTAGLNWYPNDVLRFVLDYQHTDVDKLTAAGGSADAKIDALSFRSQFSF
jgi:phosphate-selective porin OprO/OprP